VLSTRNRGRRRHGFAQCVGRTFRHVLVRPSQVLPRPAAVHAAAGPFAVTERVKVVATSGKQATSPVARRATTWYANGMRRRSGTRHMTSAELTQIRELFRAKLRQLRDEERPRAATTKRRPTRSRLPERFETITSPPGNGDVLSPGDIAGLLRVHPKTVTRWATRDGLPSFRTVGGHRRFRWTDVTAWVERGDA